MSYWRCRCKFIAIYPDIRTICAIRYASTIRYSIFDDVYRVRDTQQQKRAQARNTCVHVRRAWENVSYFVWFFRDLNWTFIPLVVLIVFQLKTKPSEDCSLSTNLSSYISYQVHRLLRRKSAIRLCVYSSQVSWQYEIHTNTHTSIHTHTYGISWLLRWEDGRPRRRQGSCDEADASTPMNEIKINFLKFLMRILWLCLHFLFLLYCIFFWCSLFSLFHLCTEHEHLQMRCHKNTFTFTYQKIDGKMIPYLCRLR